MLIETLSTFPHMYDSVMTSSMMQRAQDKGLLDFRAYDLRDWTHDRHRTTDDDPYGGGAGLVMKCEPIFEAVEDIVGVKVEDAQSCSHPLVSDTTIIFVAPQGHLFNDEWATKFSEQNHLLFVCGHYEGIDERVYALADEIISIGDYVLTSGELASMVIIDAVVRKIDGVLGAEEGVCDESFAHGLLEYPHYTRPACFRGAEVPEVLLSGNHEAIAHWRREQSLLRTFRLRPDLITALEQSDALSAADRKFLESLADDSGCL